MSSKYDNELRLLIDMQACQTPASANRGVGRYSLSFFEEIAAQRSGFDTFGMTSKSLPAEIKTTAISQKKLIEFESLPGWSSKRGYQGGEIDLLDSALISSFCQKIKPDVIHISHPFEGFSERVPIFDPNRKTSGQLVTATIYDLIPLLFEQHYFRNADFKNWYYSRVAWLKKADLLLTISDATRNDVINLLDIDPDRVVTIHGGISDSFTTIPDVSVARQRLAERFRLRENVVLYTGGDDYRKNIVGAIESFSKLPVEIRRPSQLVIVCNMPKEREEYFYNKAKSFGLEREDVLITGFVHEQQLVDLYRVCDCFIFPSLYEGLGLPVLEAMACGAPVIGSNNSSIREIIVREDALFDPNSASDTANKLEAVLVNKEFSNDLRNYGLLRSRDFNWKATAEKALLAISNARKRTIKTKLTAYRAGIMPSKRLALLTPLPPCRSGIADYNEKFIPYLQRHFEIDLYVHGNEVVSDSLNSMFRIFDVKDFEPVAKSYDVILYEIGNSEFHVHMIPLLKKYPGVVGLHDAYISGLMGYVDFQLGDSGSYVKEMVSAHGSVARRYFSPLTPRNEAIGASMVDLPCTKVIFDHALGIISHSKFNFDLSRKYFPHGCLAPYKNIPQMVCAPRKLNSNQREISLTHLGYGSEDLLITTFGHITWTKWGDKILRAFLGSNLSKQKNVKLVFAGELANDEFGSRLSASAKEAGLTDQIIITGYLSELDYLCYLQASTIGIQLRTKSRGGTPKAVLDCLANGLPVIINNGASYRDYDDDLVFKLSAEPDIEEISQCLEETVMNTGELQARAINGHNYVVAQHSPDRCAALYALAINEFCEMHQATGETAFVEAVAPYVGSKEATKAQANSILAVDWFNEINLPIWECPRLLIDVSHIVDKDHNTGIQRVVKETVRSLYVSNRVDLEVVAVQLEGNFLVEAYSWLQQEGSILENEKSKYGNRPLEMRRGDILLMLDSSWEKYSDFNPVFENAKSKNIPVITAVFDILPITLPEGNFVSGGREWFENWFRKAIASSDALVCISKSTADSVISYIKKSGFTKVKPKVGYWHLGSNFSEPDNSTTMSSRTELLGKSDYFLQVGTIEPRKSHASVLDAMELLWKDGEEICLVIAGKEGWHVGELLQRIRLHPQFEKKLFFIENPTDHEIEVLYKNAGAAILASKGEGFGLPLVEAAHFGTSIICSDIPVFREIAGDFAKYINIESGATISAGMSDWLQDRKTRQLPDTKNMPRLTWEESARELTNIVTASNWYWEN